MKKQSGGIACCRWEPVRVPPGRGLRGVRTRVACPAQERVNTSGFRATSAPSPCARARARARARPGRTERGSPRSCTGRRGLRGGRGPILRLHQDGLVAPGQGSGSPGSKAPLLLLLKGGSASASTAAAPGNAGGRGGWVVCNEYQFSAEGGLRPPSRARTASAPKPVSPLGASKPADIPGLSSVLFVALKFQEERGAMANKFAYFSFRF